MITPDDIELLAALHAEWHEEMSKDAISKLTGAQLEFHKADTDIHNAHAAMFNTYMSGAAAQAASVSVVIFSKIEAAVAEMKDLKAGMELIARRIDAGDARLIDARQEGTILRDIANEERDASTGQVDDLNRLVAALTARVARLEQRTGWLADREERE